MALPRAGFMALPRAGALLVMGISLACLALLQPGLLHGAWGGPAAAQPRELRSEHGQSSAEGAALDATEEDPRQQDVGRTQGGKVAWATEVHEWPVQLFDRYKRTKAGELVQAVGVHEQQMQLYDQYKYEWRRACGDIVDSRHDFVGHTQGKTCAKSCGNILAARQLSSWVSQRQAALQAAVRLPKVPFVPTFLLLLLALLAPYLGLGFVVTLLPSSWDWDSFLALTMGLSCLSGSVATAWATLVLSTVVMGLSSADAADVEELLAAFPWASPWTEPVAWAKNEIIPLWVLFYPAAFLVLLGAVYAGYQACEHFDRKFKEANSSAAKAYEVLLGMSLLLLCLILTALATLLGHLAFILAEHLFRAGHKGVLWSCTKAESAAVWGWVPPMAPYWLGLAYVGASVVHGLLSTPRAVIPGQPPDPRRHACLVSDAAAALGALLVKLASLLLDVLLDMAQSVMFFCRGQPFFGLFTLLGIVIQLGMAFVSAASGLIPDVSLMAALLQSDIIANFRSSWAAGMALNEFYAKSFREAFGETYLSMCISIVAVFTVEFRYASDLQLILLSLFMSLHSVKSGVAEGQEIVSAEAEGVFKGSEIRFRLLPLNDYYMRHYYTKHRSLAAVWLLRVSEALSVIVPLAVCCASSSVRATYVLAALVAFVLYMPAYLSTHGGLLLRTWRVAFWSVPEAFRREGACEAFINSMGLLLSLVGAIVWTGLMAASPLLMFPLLTLHAQTITIPEQTDEDPAIVRGDPGADSWLFTLLELALPRVIQPPSTQRFARAYAQKLVLIATVWCALVLVPLISEDSPFQFTRVWRGATDAVLQGDFSTAWWQGAIQLLLICSSGIACLTLVCTVLYLRKKRTAWEEELLGAVEACEGEFTRLQVQVRSLVSSLKSKDLLADDQFYSSSIGRRSEPFSATLPQLVLNMFINEVFGDPDRETLIKVNVFPQSVPALCRALEEGKGDTWALSEKVDNRGLPLEGGWVLCNGGDLWLTGRRSEGSLGLALSGLDDRVPAEIVKLQKKFEPKSIILVFRGQQTSELEAALRGFADCTEEGAMCASALEADIERLAAHISTDLASPLLKKTCGKRLEPLARLQTLLVALAEYSHSGLTLFSQLPHGDLPPEEQALVKKGDTYLEDLLDDLKKAIEDLPGHAELMGHG